MKKIILSFLGLILLLGLSGISVFAQGGIWETKTPMPTARVYAVGGAIENNLYVLGGSPLNGIPAALKTLEVYDSLTDSWTTKASANLARTTTAVGIINGKLYVAGGCINSNCAAFSVTNELEIYDPITNSWSTGALMPVKRAGAASAVVDDKLYVMDGFTSCGPCTSLQTVFIYDSITNSWSTGAPMLTGMVSPQAVVIDGKIYVVGGSQPAWGITNKLHVYDPVANSWAVKTPSPIQRGGFKTEALNGKIYVMGGSEPTGNPPALNTVEVYDSATDSWTIETPMSQVRYGFVSGAINGKLYAVGGWDTPFTRLSSLEVFTPAGIQEPDQDGDGVPDSIDACDNALAPAGIIGCWGLNETSGTIAADSKGSNPGNLVGGPVWTSGQVRGALQFDGINNQYVDLGYLPETNNINEITVAAWVKWEGNSISSEKMIVTRSGGYQINAGSCSDRFATYFYLDNVWSTPSCGTTEIVPNTWYYVVGIYDGQNQLLYVNGNLEKSDYQGAKTISYGASHTQIGIWTSNGWRWNGVIDEVAIYNRALSAQEINQQYQNGLQGKGYCEAAPADTQPPTITAPVDVTVPADSPAGASEVVLGVPTVSDNLDLNPTVTNDAPAVFPIGTTVVVWTAQDQAGNSTQAAQQIIVLPLPPGYTDTGADILVAPVPGVTLQFSNVLASGITTAITDSTGPAIPTQFKLGNPPVYYNLTTTAVYESPVRVCIDYSSVSYGNENKLKLLHNVPGWVDVTDPGYPDTENKIICGTAQSFSSFAVAELIDEDLVCDLNADWKNHGQYVSCIAKALGNKLKEVVDAAQSNIGKKLKKE